MRKNLRIEGMSCVVCANSVEKAVKNLSGINKAVVNLSRNRLSVDYDENAVNLSTIITSIEQAGFKAFIDLKETNSLEQEQEIKSIKSRLLISLFFGSVGGIFGMFIFRHKISKWSFLWKFILIIIFQIIFFIFLNLQDFRNLVG